MRPLVRLCALAVGAFATSVLGQKPDGLEFRANIQTTGNSRGPAVAVAPNQSFIVAWKGADVCTDCLELQWFLLRPGTPTSYQAGLASGLAAGPAVAPMPPSNFVVAYSLAATNQVLAARSTGAPGGFILPGTLVSTTTANGKESVDVASDASGNFIVVWTDAGNDGSGTGIYARRVLSSGEPRGMGGEYRINTTTAGDQRGPRVASAADGSYVVTWQSTPPGGAAQVFAQRYDATGAAAGGEFQVSTNGAPGNYFPGIGSDTTGNFVIMWTAYDQYSGYNFNVFGQRYASSGAAIGGPFRVNGDTSGIAGRPKVTVRSHDFVVVWDEFQSDNSGYAVMGRRFSSNGAPLGAIFRVNTYTTSSQYFAAIASTEGRYVVAWQSGPGVPPGPPQDGDGLGIYFQKYCLAGDANADGVVDVADVFFLINALFAGGQAPIGCGNASGNATIDVADVFYLINYLFAGGPAPV